MITITLIEFEGRYDVSCCIHGQHVELGEYDTAAEAGTRMRRWVEGRGLSFGVDSPRRVDAAQRRGSCVLTLDVITKVEYERLTEERRMAWVPYASDYIWQL